MPARAAWGVACVGVALAAAQFPMASGHGATPNHPGAPSALTVDGNVGPLGVDMNDVEFAWQVVDKRPGALQSAYRIVVTRGGATVWNSGRTPSADQSFIRYAGPALAPDTPYSWTVQTWDASGQAGPTAAPVTFTTGLSDHDWKASWIKRNVADPVDASDEYTYLRRETLLAGSNIIRATAYVTADQQYELWINGSRAGKGPAFSYPDRQYYEALDITPLVRAGTANAFGLLTHWYGVGKGRPAGTPGALLQVSITHANGAHELVVTDGSWKVTRGNWLPSSPRNQQGDPVDQTENISGVTEPVGWDQPGFVDTLWQAPVVLGQPPVAPWTHLVAQQTHIVEEPFVAVSLTPSGTGGVVADFGRVIAAVPTVTFHQGVAGRVIPMHAGFLLDKPLPGTTGRPVSSAHGTQATDMSYSYVERAGTQTFHAYDYLGFRYLQIDNPGETLRPSDVVALGRHTAVPAEYGATFASSSPTIDAVWELARHSALFATQEQFIDTPTREKGPFLRDGYNTSQTAMAAFGEQDLTRRELMEVAQGQARYWPDGRLNAIYPSGQGKRDIPDSTEIYPDWVWQYYLHTGDRGLLAALQPVTTNVANYVARYLDPATGLVTNLAGGDGDYLYGLVDYPLNMRYGYDMNTVARTAINFLAVNAFERAADIDAALGLASASMERDRAKALDRAINARLERPDGIYIDGLHAGGAPSTHASQHANAYALAYGAVPPAHVAAVAAYAAALGTAMGPQTIQYLLAGLDRAGRDDAVVARLTDVQSDGWANVLAQGGTFVWETWQPSDALGDGMSHGWGSTALVEIQQTLLGVRPTGPGYSTFDVIPPSSGLDHASGVVPTPRGPITVAWQRPATPGGTFTLDLTVPPNSTARVLLPAASPSSVAGRPRGVSLASVEGSRAVLQVGSGGFHLATTGIPAAFAGRQGAAASAPAPGGGVRPDPGAPPAAAERSLPVAGSTNHHGRLVDWLIGAALLAACGLGARRVTRARRNPA
jgi:alpha-L-rhamnosidase